MALIIHELSTDKDQIYGGTKTVQFVGSEKQHLVQLVVTIEKLKDVPKLQQFIDAFISNHTALLPDYEAIKFPCGKRLWLVIFAGENVSITLYDANEMDKGFNYQYPVPKPEQLSPPDPERDRSRLEDSN